MPTGSFLTMLSTTTEWVVTERGVLQVWRQRPKWPFPSHQRLESTMAILELTERVYIFKTNQSKPKTNSRNRRIASLSMAMYISISLVSGMTESSEGKILLEKLSVLPDE